MSSLLPSDHIDSSIFYRVNAKDFYERTVNLDVERLYGLFLPNLPRGSHILDAGCGSGRDTKAFLERGYKVTAFDASPELAQMASVLTGIPIGVVRFEEMEYVEEFDGIWTCASLLHVPQASMERVFQHFVQALKPRGYWYLSFKYGEGEVTRDRRHFSNHTETSLQRLIDSFCNLETVELLVSEDARPDRSVERWVNAIVRRRER